MDMAENFQNLLQFYRSRQHHNQREFDAFELDVPMDHVDLKTAEEPAPEIRL